MIFDLLPFGFLITFAVIVLFLIVLLFKSVLLVQQAEAIIIERMGKFDRVLMPGIHFVIPMLEAPRQVRWSFLESVQGRKQFYRYTKVLTRIDLRESLYDFPKQNVITKDNVTMEI